MGTKVLEQPIKTFDFALVVSDKKLKGSGLSRGDEVLVMSSKDIATKSGDPWLKRTMLIVALVKEDKVLIPKDGNDHKAYVVDPRNLQKVSDGRGKELSDAISKR